MYLGINKKFGFPSSVDNYILKEKYSYPKDMDVMIKEVKNFFEALEEKEIYVSTTTACSKGSFSLPLYALTSDVDRASRSIRVSISHLTTKEELDIFIKELKLAINKLTLRN